MILKTMILHFTLFCREERTPLRGPPQLPTPFSTFELDGKSGHVKETGREEAVAAP
jgi:hypothetical protein